MLFGFILLGTLTSMLSGGCILIIILSLLGLPIGGTIGWYMKKKYKDINTFINLLERNKLKIVAMIKSFENVKAQYDKEMQLYLLECIVLEAERILDLEGNESLSEYCK